MAGSLLSSFTGQLEYYTGMTYILGNEVLVIIDLLQLFTTVVQCKYPALELVHPVYHLRGGILVVVPPMSDYLFSSGCNTMRSRRPLMAGEVSTPSGALIVFNISGSPDANNYC